MQYEHVHVVQCCTEGPALHADYIHMWLHYCTPIMTGENFNDSVKELHAALGKVVTLTGLSVTKGGEEAFCPCPPLRQAANCLRFMLYWLGTGFLVVPLLISSSKSFHPSFFSLLSVSDLFIQHGIQLNRVWAGHDFSEHNCGMRCYTFQDLLRVTREYEGTSVLFS